MKPIPKSLHTVTVLRRVASHIADTEELLPEDCLQQALDVLGLSDLEDCYGLVQQAKAQIIRAAGGAA
jgi:hypothetical protein